MRLVLPFGFYGAGNTGDEATLTGFARLVREYPRSVNVWCGSRNPAHTARIEPHFRYFKDQGRDFTRLYVKLRANAYAVAGGTPIQDVLGDWPLNELVHHLRTLCRKGRPFSFIGVGVEDLRQEASRRLIAEEFAPRVCHWSVRSERGRDHLLEYGVPGDRISVAADLAWLIDPAGAAAGIELLQTRGVDTSRPLIAVNVANENEVFDRHPQMPRNLAAALDRLAIERDAQVLFIAADVREDSGFDKAAALKVLACMARPERARMLPNEYFSPHQLMSIIACCRLTLSMRYHFCLFSALQSVPFIGIQRTDKVLDLCWDLNWKALIVPPDFQPDEIVGQAETLHREEPSLLSGLRERITVLKSRALLNLDALRTLDPA